MDPMGLSEDGLDAIINDLVLKNALQSSMSLLPPLPNGFTIPTLPDVPQNPIMDRIKHDRQSSAKGPDKLEELPPELRLLTLDQGLARFDEKLQQPLDRLDIWQEGLTRSRGLKNRAFNWDSLHLGHYNDATTTKLISEQDPAIVAAARQQVSQPDHEQANHVYASQNKILNALKLTVLGASSVFHTWDEAQELFVQTTLEGGKPDGVLVDSFDKTLSRSVLDRFLRIGTLLRRLEIFMRRLRESSPQKGPTVSALAHALSMVISLLRKDLARGPPTPSAPLVPQPELTATWMHYEIFEITLVALSHMCGCEAEKRPDQYTGVTTDYAPLLDLIYSHLNLHICGKSPRFLIAIFAFIMTTVSDDYFRKLSHSIGYLTDAHHSQGSHQSNVYLPDDGYELDGSDDEIEDGTESSWDVFPEFLPPELLDILPAAQKSLTLLKAAQPDHPLLNNSAHHAHIRWIWDEESIMASWEGTSSRSPKKDLDSIGEVGGTIEENDKFALFRVFDLEPGTTASFSTVTTIGSLQALESFIESFPESLPSIAPELSHLTSLVMAPLVDHASTLAGALLNLFLTSSDNLNFHSHLVLLRSYLLVTGHQFRARLSSALFSDSEDTQSEETTQQMSAKYLKHKPKRAEITEVTTWAMGLSPGLLERGEWPPINTDVNFFLRTVIVDSLDTARDGLLGMGVTEQVRREGEYRLGFVLRSPSGEMKSKWIDPLGIEALDFIYMTYRPPRPLEVLITSNIVNKYQRLFSFLVRLMRVEHAMDSLFRITRKHSHQLFPTLVDTQRLLLHFRFVSQSFISNLARYVFDTAIGGNFDPFVEKLSASTTMQSGRHQSGYTDVFSLAKSHSEMLDDILSACMLRTWQQGMLDVLRSLLQTILDFCVHVGTRYLGQKEEYEVAPVLEELYQKFRRRMVLFVRNLRKLMDGEKESLGLAAIQHQVQEDGTKQTVGGAEALRHLLIRLDLGKWWITFKK